MFNIIFNACSHPLMLLALSALRVEELAVAPSSEAPRQMGSGLRLDPLWATSSLPPPDLRENQELYFVNLGNLIFFSFN